jgi:hypothetical protein
MLDEQNSPISQQFDQMINAAAQRHRKEIEQQLSDKPEPAPAPQPAAQQPTNAQPPNDYWFLNQNQPAPGSIPKDNVVFATPSVVQPGMQAAAQAGPAPADDHALAEQLRDQAHRSDPSNAHLKTIDPNGPKKLVQPNPLNANLARNNDLNISTLARQARKAQDSEGDDGEVVVPLH